MALAEHATRDDLGSKLVRVFTGFGTEINPLADPQLPPGVYQRLPLHGVGRKLLREQHPDPTTKKLARGGVLRRDRLRSRAAAVSEEAGWQDLCIVEDQHIVRSKQFGKVAKSEIFGQLLGAIEVKQARGSPVGQRLLGDQVVRKAVVEIRNQHTPIMPDRALVTYL